VSERRRLVTGFVVLTAALGIALAIRPLPTQRILAVYVLALAAIGLAAITRIAASHQDRNQSSVFEHALRRSPPRPMRPPELVRTEREITLGMGSAGHLHQRLLPLLREAAAVRLATRHSVDLDRRPEQARLLLGDDIWELLRPDRPEPADRHAPGISSARLRRVVDALERI
jgi:hypothetical protein